MFSPLVLTLSSQLLSNLFLRRIGNLCTSRYSSTTSKNNRLHLARFHCYSAIHLRPKMELSSPLPGELYPISLSPSYLFFSPPPAKRGINPIDLEDLLPRSSYYYIPIYPCLEKRIRVASAGDGALRDRIRRGHLSLALPLF